jgi:hypothetical protein
MYIYITTAAVDIAAGGGRKRTACVNVVIVARSVKCTPTGKSCRFGYLQTVFLKRRDETRTPSRLFQKTVFF